MKSVPLSSQNTVELTTSLPFLQHSLLVLLHELLLSFETSAGGIRTNSVSHLNVKLVTCFSGVLKKIIAQLIKCNCSEQRSVTRM
jgi:hypothetical protein